jgi:uncharacterized protein YneF (UPF0154 family)
MNFLKSALCEANGDPSSVRIGLWVILFTVVGVVVYFITRHVLTGEVVDCPPALANLLSVAIGSLSAAKGISKFAESKLE